jgi:hypothetical protein
MTYKVNLIYFRQTGKFLATAETMLGHDELVDIWEEVDDMRRMGRLPGLRPGAGRDLFVIVDVPDHPKRVLHMVTPPFQDEDDVTPLRIPTSEMVPLTRIPLEEMPLEEMSRTSTRDVVKVDPSLLDKVDPDADTVVGSEGDITPPDQPLPPSSNKPR